MKPKHPLNWLIVHLGGDVHQVRILDRALLKDRNRRRQQALEKVGWDLALVRFFEKGIKLQCSIMLLVLTWMNRGEPGLAAAVFFSAQVLLLSGLVVWDLFQGLMDDTVWRTIGSWPISSRTYLLARLMVPLRNSLKLSLLLVTPSALLIGINEINPAAALLFECCGLLIAPAVVIAGAGFLMLLIHLVGIRRLRSGLVLLLVVLLGGSGLLRVHLYRLITEPNPVWDMLPTGWLAQLVAGAVGGSWTALGAGLAGILAWLAVPFIMFRATAHSYTRNLGQARIVTRDVKGGDLFQWLLPKGRGIHHVYRQLLLSHLREDWRFRLQVALMPTLLVIMVVAAFFGVDLERFFADPFGSGQTFHPAMITVVAVMVPPILSLPFLSQSQDYQAGWLLRTGMFSLADYSHAVRKYIRCFFVFPLLVVFALGYLLAGVSVTSIAIHLFFLFMLSETMAAFMQTQFGKLPFSMPPQDEETAATLIVVFLVFQTFSLLIALAVYHVVYRWPVAYVVSVCLLWVLARGQLHTRPTEVRPEPDRLPMGTPSLVVAVKEARFHTVKLLLAGGADPHARDDQGKTALSWARELGFEHIANLLPQERKDED